MDRRRFLQSVLAGAGSLALPSFGSELQSATEIHAKDLRWLWLTRQVNSGKHRRTEEYKIKYFEHGQLLTDGYIEACHALRDIHESPNQQVVQMDILLLDLIFSCQEWLRYHSYLKPVQVLSAYRSPRRNAQIENAARNSMHMYGKAIDVRIDGLSTKYIGELGAWFQAGGIGWYYNDRFVHLDTGRVRSWTR